MRVKKYKKPRDESALIEAGWRVVTIWECELKRPVIEQTISSLLQIIVER